MSPFEIFSAIISAISPIVVALITVAGVIISALITYRSKLNSQNQEKEIITTITKESKNLKKYLASDKHKKLPQELHDAEKILDRLKQNEALYSGYSLSAKWLLKNRDVLIHKTVNHLKQEYKFLQKDEDQLKSSIRKNLLWIYKTLKGKGLDLPLDVRQTAGSISVEVYIVAFHFIKNELNNNKSSGINLKFGKNKYSQLKQTERDIIIMILDKLIDKYTHIT